MTKTFKITYKPYLPHPDPETFGRSVLSDRVETAVVDAASSLAAREWFLSGEHAEIVSIEEIVCRDGHSLTGAGHKREPTFSGGGMGNQNGCAD